jgi:hypothetical protein
MLVLLLVLLLVLALLLLPSVGRPPLQAAWQQLILSHGLERCHIDRHGHSCHHGHQRPPLEPT